MKKQNGKHAGGRPRELEATIAFNVRLPADTWAALRARAENEERPMSDVARRALAEWLLAKAMQRSGGA